MTEDTCYTQYHNILYECFMCAWKRTTRWCWKWFITAYCSWFSISSGSRINTDCHMFMHVVRIDLAIHKWLLSGNITASVDVYFRVRRVFPWTLYCSLLEFFLEKRKRVDVKTLLCYSRNTWTYFIQHIEYNANAHTKKKWTSIQVCFWQYLFFRHKKCWKINPTPFHRTLQRHTFNDCHIYCANERIVFKF